MALCFLEVACVIKKFSWLNWKAGVFHLWILTFEAEVVPKLNYAIVVQKVAPTHFCDAKNSTAPWKLKKKKAK